MSYGDIPRPNYSVQSNANQTENEHIPTNYNCSSFCLYKFLYICTLDWFRTEPLLLTNNLQYSLALENRNQY